MDRTKLVDDRGKPLTQSLFLEIGYTDYSYYTLKEEDYTYKGKVYPSLKKLYLQHEDPTEYDFANRFLLNWKHWQKICGNRQLLKYIEEWREELELKLRSQAVRDMIDQSVDKGSFQASKWLADRGWDKKAAGRPSKTEAKKEQRIKDQISAEFEEDNVRLFK